MFTEKEATNIDFIRVSACFRLEKILKKQGVLVEKKFIKKNKIQGYFLCTNQKNENLKYCLEFFLPAETKFSLKERGTLIKKWTEIFMYFPTHASEITGFSLFLKVRWKKFF